jgi:hypothetical protein
LATRAPAAAATKIVAVEMLKVCAVAAGADDVDEVVVSAPRPWWTARASPGGGGDLADGLLLDAQAGEDGGGHHREISPAMIWRISESISSWKISRCSITLQGFLGGNRGHGGSRAFIGGRGSPRSRKFFSRRGRTR